MVHITSLEWPQVSLLEKGDEITAVEVDDWTTGKSSNIAIEWWFDGDFLGDFDGDFLGDFDGDFHGDFDGDFHGDFDGDLMVIYIFDGDLMYATEQLDTTWYVMVNQSSWSL